MDEEVDVVVLGFDVAPTRAAEELARVFGLSPAEARAFVEGVPRAAKHGTSPTLAARYAEALRHIGARVELRTVRPASSGRPELPEPTPPKRSDVLQLGLEGGEENVIERFRTARGVSPSMDPAREAAAYEETVPRAPKVPHDMHRMPNAILPRWSERPLDEEPIYSAAPPRDHSNADVPPAFTFLDDEGEPPPPPPTPASSPVAATRRAEPRAAAAATCADEPAATPAPRAKGLLPSVLAAGLAVALLLLWLVLR